MLLVLEFVLDGPGNWDSPAKGPELKDREAMCMCVCEPVRVRSGKLKWETE